MLVERNGEIKQTMQHRHKPTIQPSVTERLASLHAVRSPKHGQSYPRRNKLVPRIQGRWTSGESPNTCCRLLQNGSMHADSMPWDGARVKVAAQKRPGP